MTVPTITINEETGTITIVDIPPVDLSSWSKGALRIAKDLVRGENFPVIIQGRMGDAEDAAGESAALLIQMRTAVPSGLVQPGIHDCVAIDGRSVAVEGNQAASLFGFWSLCEFSPGTDGRAAGITSAIKNEGSAEPKIGRPLNKWAYEAFASGAQPSTAAFWIRGKGNRPGFFHGLIASAKTMIIGIVEVINRIRIRADGKVLRYAGDGITTPADLEDAGRVRDIESPLEKLLGLRGVEVKWKAPMSRHGGQRGWAMVLDGAAAEEVFPEWVEVDENGHRLVTADGWQALAVEAIRKLESRVAALESAAAAP